MVKNVKIDSVAHRSLSIKASELEVLKGDLCSALVTAALAKFTDDEIRQFLRDATTSKTEYRGQGIVRATQPVES
jgi:hypothetical protein